MSLKWGNQKNTFIKIGQSAFVLGVHIERRLEIEVDRREWANWIDKGRGWWWY